MSAFHRDEGVPADDGAEPDGHVHDLGVCKDAEGHYCGNRIDAKLMIKINAKFPAMMRQRGWDMEDLDTTDFERAKTDKDYAVERNAKRKKSGLSVNKHLSRKAKQAQDEVAEILQEALQVSDEATERMQLAGELMLEADAKEQYANAIVADAKAKAERKEQRANVKEQRANKIVFDAEVRVKQAEQRAAAVNDEMREKESEIGKLESTRQSLAKTIEGQQKQIQEWVDNAAQQREAIIPTAAGSTAFVLNLLMRSKMYRGNDTAQEYLMQFIDYVERFKTGINQRHESWRNEMRERRRADKQANHMTEQIEHGGLEIQ